MLSYATCITLALDTLGGASKALTIRQIYAFFESHDASIPMVAKPNWKTSVRHTLSGHNCFYQEVQGVRRLWLYTETKLPKPTKNVMARYRKLASSREQGELDHRLMSAFLASVRDDSKARSGSTASIADSLNSSHGSASSLLHGDMQRILSFSRQNTHSRVQAGSLIRSLSDGNLLSQQSRASTTSSLSQANPPNSWTSALIPPGQGVANNTSAAPIGNNGSLYDQINATFANLAQHNALAQFLQGHQQPQPQTSSGLANEGQPSFLDQLSQLQASISSSLATTSAPQTRVASSTASAANIQHWAAAYASQLLTQQQPAPTTQSSQQTETAPARSSHDSILNALNQQSPGAPSLSNSELFASLGLLPEGGSSPSQDHLLQHPLSMSTPNLFDSTQLSTPVLSRAADHAPKSPLRSPFLAPHAARPEL
eukprot:TRINITY_DN2780_c0_g1_i1.p1 TRINITY_DN2780_c0_g1~~TRINITY_DN2780_c0_g1_i1.p1  ORF type:complete len:428 (+),score=47.22 TRINITY_DN2780_c0_g1_i1:363-1646(+)